MRIVGEMVPDGVRAYINVGAGFAAIGSHVEEKSIPAGILERREAINLSYSLLREMLLKGVPVINYMHVQTLARRNGLSVAPIPLPQPGKGELFMKERYSVPLASALAILLGVLIFFVMRFDLTGFLSKKWSS
jgi:hypothetical protein